MPKPIEKRSPPDYSRVVHARISAGADDELQRRADLAGVKKSIYVRQLIYRSLGFYEAPTNRASARRRQEKK